MQARIEESRAQLVESQAAVPQAMADAFRNGKLNILDYFKLQNVNADTEMRKALAGNTREATESLDNV